MIEVCAQRNQKMGVFERRIVSVDAKSADPPMLDVTNVRCYFGNGDTEKAVL